MKNPDTQNSTFANRTSRYMIEVCKRDVIQLTLKMNNFNNMESF